MLTNATSDMHKNAAQGNSMKMQHKISMHGYATHKNATKGVSMRDIWGALMRNAHLMHYNAHKCTAMRTGENDTAYGIERHVTCGGPPPKSMSTR